MRYLTFGYSRVFKLPEGKIFIRYSDEKISFGYLLLDPKTKLDKHKRPVDEELVQIEGESIITIFSSHGVGEFTLQKGDYIRIPANRKHIHQNRTSKPSLTLWKFEGDIRETINNITNTFKEEQMKY